jgi:hypothetical protein
MARIFLKLLIKKKNPLRCVHASVDPSRVVLAKALLHQMQQYVKL